MIFDESVRIPPLWIDESSLKILNQHREGVQKKQTNKKTKNWKKAYPLNNNVKKEKEEDYGFCHQCKQRKSKIILAKCSYNSAAYGHSIPSFMIVKGIKAYNVEVYNTQAINFVIKSQLSDPRK